MIFSSFFANSRRVSKIMIDYSMILKMIQIPKNASEEKSAGVRQSLRKT